MQSRTIRFVWERYQRRSSSLGAVKDSRKKTADSYVDSDRVYLRYRICGNYPDGGQRRTK